MNNKQGYISYPPQKAGTRTIKGNDKTSHKDVGVIDLSDGVSDEEANLAGRTLSQRKKESKK